MCCGARHGAPTGDHRVDPFRRVQVGRGYAPRGEVPRHHVAAAAASSFPSIVRRAQPRVPGRLRRARACPGRSSASWRGLRSPRPFPIQAATIPDALAGRDVLGRGADRFGQDARLRTAAAGPDRGGRPVRAAAAQGRWSWCPTRELAMQVNDALTPLAKAMRLFTKTAFGGAPYQSQIYALRARRRRARRDARPTRRPHREGRLLARRGRDQACSTRPTRWRTWGSCLT